MWHWNVLVLWIGIKPPSEQQYLQCIICGHMRFLVFPLFLESSDDEYEVMTLPKQHATPRGRNENNDFTSSTARLWSYTVHSKMTAIGNLANRFYPRPLDLSWLDVMYVRKWVNEITPKCHEIDIRIQVDYSISKACYPGVPHLPLTKNGVKNRTRKWTRG